MASRSIQAARYGLEISDFRIRLASRSPLQQLTTASLFFDRAVSRSPMRADSPKETSRGRREPCRIARETSGSRIAATTRLPRYREETTIEPSTSHWDRYRLPDTR